MNKRILYVVHRYAPYPGGSENYVRDMAEETQRRGNYVAVFTGEHKGDLNGVVVTSDVQVLNQSWDLIVVHGGDVALQDFVLSHSHVIRSPMLFMLIVPSYSNVYRHAIQHVKYVACSTKEDWNFVNLLGCEKKSVRVRHGIDVSKSVGTKGFRQKYNINTKYMFLSCGGYWPNKAMPELVDLFKNVNRDDITLVLTGYDNRHNIMPKSEGNVKTFMIDDRNEVLSAISDADLYIMHSFKEGFGLVLLESMLNNTPWAARNLAGARLMSEYGFAYNTDDELLKYMQTFESVSEDSIETAHKYMMSNHTIAHTVDDILRLCDEV